jgi:transcriptional regulator with PAS, ATPase and Fis domain
MNLHEWVDTIGAAVTVCDAAGTIVEMNERSALVFAKDGGRALIGTNLLDCHPEPARSKLRRLMEERRANTYTIEKKGRRTLIHQAPWYRGGEFAGFVEISFPIPAELPNFVRDGG